MHPGHASPLWCFFIPFYYVTVLPHQSVNYFSEKYSVMITDKFISNRFVHNGLLSPSPVVLQPTTAAVPSPHLHILTRGVCLPSSLCCLPLCQAPLIPTNTHLQPTIEALFGVGTLRIQPPPIKDWDLDRRVSESYLKVSQSGQHMVFCYYLWL